jgi:hypothetical protein
VGGVLDEAMGLTRASAVTALGLDAANVPVPAWAASLTPEEEAGALIALAVHILRALVLTLAPAARASSLAIGSEGGGCATRKLRNLRNGGAPVQKQTLLDRFSLALAAVAEEYTRSGAPKWGEEFISVIMLPSLSEAYVLGGELRVASVDGNALYFALERGMPHDQVFMLEVGSRWAGLGRAAGASLPSPGNFVSLEELVRVLKRFWGVPWVVMSAPLAAVVLAATSAHDYSPSASKAMRQGVTAALAKPELVAELEGSLVRDPESRRLLWRGRHAAMEQLVRGAAPTARLTDTELQLELTRAHAAQDMYGSQVIVTSGPGGEVLLARLYSASPAIVRPNAVQALLDATPTEQLEAVVGIAAGTISPHTLEPLTPAQRLPPVTLLPLPPLPAAAVKGSPASRELTAAVLLALRQRADTLTAAALATANMTVLDASSTGKAAALAEYGAGSLDDWAPLPGLGSTGTGPRKTQSVLFEALKANASPALAQAFHTSPSWQFRITADAARGLLNSVPPPLEPTPLAAGREAVYNERALALGLRLPQNGVSAPLRGAADYAVAVFAYPPVAALPGSDGFLHTGHKDASGQPSHTRPYAMLFNVVFLATVVDAAGFNPLGSKRALEFTPSSSPLQPSWKQEGS